MGTLYLIPSSIGEGTESMIPQHSRSLVEKLNIFVVENERSARRFLRSIDYMANFDLGQMFLLDKNDPEAGINEMISSLLEGNDVGLLSEAGFPAVADPGHLLVREAHKHSIKVVPLAGPTSILMALAASGLNGQCFTFHGYVPLANPERAAVLRKWEKDAAAASQIFMETPYRNHALLDDIIKNCSGSSMLCIAVNIGTPQEFIKTQSVNDWKRMKVQMHKQPAMFILG